MQNCTKNKTNKQKKHLKGLDNHVGVVTHPKPDILECEIKWALGSTAANKGNRGDGIPAEPFKILKDFIDSSIKMLRSVCQQIWKTSSGHRSGKGQSPSKFPRRAVLKVQTTGQLHSSPTLIRSCSKSPN